MLINRFSVAVKTFTQSINKTFIPHNFKSSSDTSQVTLIHKKNIHPHDVKIKRKI